MPSILSVNGGSSSVKFALYRVGDPLEPILCGSIDRIGLGGTTLTARERTVTEATVISIPARDHRSAANVLIDWLRERNEFRAVAGIGHRVVHGMRHFEPELASQDLLDELHRLRPYNPDHLPLEIELIEVFRQKYPQLPQVACFDTAFHRSLPRVARMLPIPRRFDVRGVRRYGFHGLSYSYLMEELEKVAGAPTASGRIILAHLGNGASLAAVRRRKSIDTSMGFTPASGMPMGTRSGDLDPGLAPYLARTEALSPTQFYHMVNHESGLLGVSGTSSDMRELLAAESDDVRAAEAVALFCYQAKKWLGSFSAVLGGLDTLVFSGGIGENSPLVRTRICRGLRYLGIELDPRQNTANAPVISKPAGRVTVRVIRTDEELMIARSVMRLMRLPAMKAA